MCGICGKLNYDSAEPIEPGLLDEMMGTMRHRGPDGEGSYLHGPVGLGHRRLSIIDLSTGGQPICNEDQSVWIVFNGEIYNYQELREELLQKGHSFKTAGDSETIIHLYEEYGPECLHRLQGMFAFAIWDSGKQQLFVARDRVGIKPLYYCDTGRSFLFASEIKSILADPAIKREINLPAIGRFLAHFYVPGEDTLLVDIKKLDPGHFLQIAQGGKIRKQKYWDLNMEPGSDYQTVEDAADALQNLLKETVKSHMISDVPVGFLLSGGVDSTGLLAYAVDQTDKNISTFTIGFEGHNFADERPYARLAAQRFGTSHYDMSMTAEDFRDFLPKYVWHMEEPVCEPPAIALHYVSHLARNHVKVLLSGEGGDEAFGGYNEYRNLGFFESLKRQLGPLNPTASWALKGAGRMFGSNRAKKYAPLFTSPLSEYYLSRTSSPFSCFNRSKATLYSENFFARAGNGYSTAVTRELFKRVASKDLLSQMLYIDTKTWLPDDLLIKADKITMANSLELRVPLLDHKVLEFAAKLPPEFKVRGLSCKRVLKVALRDRVPREILDRKKTGFPVPYGKWLNGELKDYVRDILSSKRCAERGFFRRGTVDGLLKTNSLHNGLTKEVFSLLVLELWNLQFIDSRKLEACV